MSAEVPRLAVPADLFGYVPSCDQGSLRAVDRFKRRGAFKRLSIQPAASWKDLRKHIENIAGDDFLAASRGSDFAWFGPIERQATSIFCHFFQSGDEELRLRRAESLGRSLGVLADDESLTAAAVSPERVCGPRRRHRADISAELVTPERKIMIVIEAKFEHRAQNPWGSYEALGSSDASWHGFIVAPRRTREIKAVEQKRRKEWRFFSWSKLLRNLNGRLAGIDDDDFRRFRATLLRRAEGLSS